MKTLAEKLKKIDNRTARSTNNVPVPRNRLLSIKFGTILPNALESWRY